MMMRRTTLTLVILLAGSSWASAQTQPGEQPLGLRWPHAAIAVESSSISFDEEDAERRTAVRLEFGGRLRGPLSMPVWLHLTPGIGLMFTNVRSIPDDSQGFAYAGLDLGARATLAKHRRFRPFVSAGWGFKQTAERASADGRILNLAGRGSRFALGLEIPLTEEDRGIEIGVSLVRGRYTRAEYQREWEDIDMRHRSMSVFAGWSGRFTGISLPWASQNRQ